MTNPQPIAFIVEDDKNLAHAFGQALSEAYYDVEVIRDGHQALKRLREESPRTVILDLHIPFLNGEELLNFIRLDQRLAETKVIITTADERRGDELRDKADLVLIKPIGFRQLRDLAYRFHPDYVDPEE